MKIASITPIGKNKVYDLSVKDVEHYVLENGVVTHNTGIMYSADNVWIIGRQQEKDGTEIQGYHFIINIEKSRYVKEKSKIPITVTYEGGVNKWSGLMDLAVSGKYLGKPIAGWYQKIDKETGEFVGEKYRAKDIVDSDEFWTEMLEKTDLEDYIEKKYSLAFIGEVEGEDDD
jgi:hypothetical protein